MKLNKVQINPEFEDLFTYKTKEEQIEHESEMISFRILSEVEKICELKKIKKKDLAELVETSRSYITQLFRGNKQVNTYIMAKFQDALEISFEIKAKLNEESHQQFLNKMLSKDFICQKKFYTKGFAWYGLQESDDKDTTETLVIRMQDEVNKMKSKGKKQQAV